jgi:hypothetical protein
MFQRVCMKMTPHAAVALALLAAAGCGGSARRDTQAVAPELKLDGVQFRIYRGDTLRAFGEAETASLRRDSSELRAQRLEATLPRGETPTKVTAPTGEGSLATRRFQATGGVVVSRGGDSARTDRARYEPSADGSGDGLVRGDDPVIVSGRDYQLTGTGFTLDPTVGTIVVRGGARLVAGLPGGR